MINLATPPGLQPPAVIDEALVHVLERRHATRHEPVQFDAAVLRVRHAQFANARDELDAALVDLAAATMAAIVHQRAPRPQHEPEEVLTS